MVERGYQGRVKVGKGRERGFQLVESTGHDDKQLRRPKF